MARRLVAIFALISVALGATAFAQNRVCVEEVAGVCLKFEATEAPSAAQPRPNAPSASPAERTEQALALSRAERRDVQRGLRAEGFYRSSIDGLFGRGTRGAIGSWQRANGLSASGYLTGEQARRLRLLGQQTAGAASSGAVAGSSASQASVAASQGDPAELGRLIGGLGCTAEVHGENARVVFRRDGGAAAAAVDVSLFVTWTFENRRFCILNRGTALTCFPLEMPITAANRDQIREHIQRNCS